MALEIMVSIVFGGVITLIVFAFGIALWDLLHDL